MTAALTRISVIIVNYGTADLTIDAVNSVLERDHGRRSVDIHVVENGSPDDSAAALRRAAEGWRDRVTLYVETENHGFGGGNNVALRVLCAQDTPPDGIFLLNPDARLENEAIDRLAQALEADPEAGFAGAGVRNGDGGPGPSAFRFPSVVSEFASTLSFGPVDRLFKSWQVPLPADHPAGPVDWVTGAAFLGRRAAWEAVEFFDEGFFLYYEEVDLMRRARGLGWRTLYIPEAQVAHIEGGSTGVAETRAARRRMPQYHYDSWTRYFLKSHGRLVAVLAALARLIGGAGQVLLTRLRGRQSGLPAQFFGDVWAFCLKPLFGRGS